MFLKNDIVEVLLLSKDQVLVELQVDLVQHVLLLILFLQSRHEHRVVDHVLDFGRVEIVCYDLNLLGHGVHDRGAGSQKNVLEGRHVDSLLKHGVGLHKHALELLGSDSRQGLQISNNRSLGHHF